jgi:hypothetical protein
MSVKPTRCPNPKCSGHVIQKSSTPDEFRLRLKGALVLKSDGLVGRCFWCNTEVTLPLELRKALPKDRFTITVHTACGSPDLDEETGT